MQVFFSYSPADRDFARQLAKEITNWGFRVWMSTDELLPGANPWLEIGKALENSQALVILISPDSLKSEWLNSQLEYALGNEKFRDRVFPVLVRPTKQIPWILEKLKTYDVTLDKNEPSRIGELIAQRLKRVA
jgi:hypothetical protein